MRRATSSCQPSSYQPSSCPSSCRWRRGRAACAATAQRSRAPSPPSNITAVGGCAAAGPVCFSMLLAVGRCASVSAQGALLASHTSDASPRGDFGSLAAGAPRESGFRQPRLVTIDGPIRSGRAGGSRSPQRSRCGATGRALGRRRRLDRAPAPIGNPPRSLPLPYIWYRVCRTRY